MTRTTTATIVAICVAGVLVSAQSAPRRGTGSTAPSTTAAVLSGSPLNLNTATSAQLEALPGIGKATADRIIEYRQKAGSFKKVEELMNVRGIGEKSFLTLKPLITVGPAKVDREP